MSATLNVFGNVREYDTDLDVFGVAFEWEAGTDPDPVFTTLLTLVGSSAKRLSLSGVSNQRLTVRGASQRRHALGGASK